MTAHVAADPTGRQLHLASADGRVTAQIAQVGASLRSLRVDDVDLVPPYPAGTATPSASGITLFPWPNRVRDGRWTQRGETRQLAVTEPRTGNASHGLLRFVPYQAQQMTDAAAALAATVYPQTGYPFQLELSVAYALTPNGIVGTHRATNVGDSDAPVALGVHPYLCRSDVPTADLTITVPAATWFAVDDQLVPVAQHPVDVDTDLRQGRRVGDLEIDRAYGMLDRDHDGRARVTLTAPDGRGVSLWLGEGMDYVQVFTMHTYPGHDVAVAIEPMTAPADALNSGQGLTWLAPGATVEWQWGIESTGS